jgi:hypothetical protein
MAKNVTIDALVGEIDTAAGYVRFTYYGEAEVRGIVVQDPAAMVGINQTRSRRARRWPSSPPGAVTFDVSLGRQR